MIPIASLRHNRPARCIPDHILVTAVSVTRVFIPTKQKHRELWTHSLQVATAARRIAQLGHASRKEQETAYVAGLLHDLGRFIMLEQDAQKLLEIDESCWSNPDEMLRQELAVAGIDHTETGRVLCQAWKLPVTLVSVVRHHHDDGSTKALDASLRSLIETVQMADRLSVVLMRQNRLRGLEPGMIEQRIETLCRMKHWTKDPAHAGRLAEAVPEIVEESDRMIQDLMLGATG
ncbi:MAG: HDOD domain-containing protein [Planctomycetota bacterium]